MYLSFSHYSTIAKYVYREEPETFHFLAAHDTVPLKTEYKPTLKVLSRKPTPTIVKRFDPVTGLEKLVLDEGEDEVEVKPAQLSAEELKAKTQRDREEKQKRYDEARARILGTSRPGSSSPGTVTPPIGDEGRSNRGKGRGRGGGSGGGGGGGVTLDNRRPDSQSGSKELFDPNYTQKPGTNAQKRNTDPSRSGKSTPREEDQILRTPKGPDASGRGGFGFARRGGKPA